jgi:hypothetical protein
MGMYGATIGIAVAIGPLVGGALTDSLGWESIFYLNVPIGLAAIAITVLRLRESRDPNATRADWPGVATFSAALFVLVLALLRGNDEGWGSALIVSLLAGAGALLVAFVAVERRVAEPMLPLALFRRRAFTGMQIAAVAISGSIFALFLYLTLYLQNYLGLSPLQPAHERHRRRLGLDDAARRLPRRRRRHGPAQPGHRRRGRERRARRAGRHGGRDQQHVPPGRGRRRHRRVGRDLRRAGR